MDKLIIHISGPSGSGKTTLGNKFKEHFGNKIIVKDTDELRHEFIKGHYGNNRIEKFDKHAYQKHIDDYIKNQPKKPLVFVGLNHIPWWNKNHYYNMHAAYNYYIDLDDKTILIQSCKRLLSHLANSESDMEYLVENNEKHIKNVSNAIAYECSLKKISKQNKIYNKYYKKHGYKIMTREDIYKSVIKLLK